MLDHHSALKVLPEWLSFAIITFIGFFPMVDALGMVPVFNSLTQGLPEKLTRYVAWRSNLIAFFLTLFFGLIGESLFEVFHITIHGLKIVGGVIFFLMGYDMLNAKMSSFKINSAEHFTKESANEIALTPLAMPLLCGPGAITTSIIFMDKTEGNWSLKFGFLLGLVLTFAFSWGCFASARSIFKLIGENGNKVVLRLTGLLLMIIAVESFFSGLTPIIRKILKI